MPTLDIARISTDGSGTISFQSDGASTTPLITSTDSALALVGVTVSGENIGPGFGLFAGLDSSPPSLTLLKFKSLFAGQGIILTDLGDCVMLSTEAATFFVSLSDGPGKIIGNAVLVGNAVSGKLDWSAPPQAANSVLTWSNNTIGWVAADLLGSNQPLLANGDEAIAVTITAGANSQTVNVSLRDTMVVAGAYTAPNFTVDSQGRIVSIANGTLTPLTGLRILGDTAIRVTGSPVYAGSNTITLSLADITPSVAGSYGFASLTVDSKGRVTAITENLAPLTQISGDAAIGANTSSVTGSVSLSLLPSGVAAGQYSYATVTIDTTGRVTNAVAGQAISRLDVVTDNALTVVGTPVTATGTLRFALANTAVTPGLYSFANITIDAQGRVQNAVSGTLAPPVTLLGIQANAANVVSLYAGTANATSYFSALRATANVTFSLSNTAVIAGQTPNSGVITVDLGDTDVQAGTYITVTIDRKGRVTSGAQIQIAGGTLTGDVLGSSAGPGSFANGVYTMPNIATTLAPIFSGTATFTQVVVNSKGLVTAGSFTNAVAGLSLTLSGDATGSGSLSSPIALTLSTVMTPGSYSQVTVDAKGRVINGVVATNQSIGFVNLSGDVSAIGNCSIGTPVLATLANTGVVAGTYSQVVVNSKGLITFGLSVPTTVALIGDVSGTENANGIVSTTLAASGVTSGTYGTGSLIPVLSVDSKGRIISAGTTAVLPATPTNTQVLTALGYTPVNKAGDTMTGGLTMSGALHVNAGVFDAYQAMPANTIDLNVATYFSKTITTTTTFTVSNAASGGGVSSFMLELVNAGAFTVNFMTGTTWNNGTKPTFSTSGTDLLAFISYNGGSTWRGLLLAKSLA